MKATGLVFSARSYIGSAEPPATVLEDESRWGNDGTFEADGKPDWVRLPSGLWVTRHNGSDSGVNLGTPASLFPTTGTYLVWYQTTVSGEVQYLFAISLVGSNEGEMRLGILINAFDYVLFGIRDASVEKSVKTVVELDVNAWYQTAVVFGIGGMKMYTNGVVEADTDASTAPPKALVDFMMGTERPTPQNTFTGFMALMKIYNYALSVEQIAAIFQAERHWFGV